jgi:hypothetical protein
MRDITSSLFIDQELTAEQALSNLSPAICWIKEKGLSDVAVLALSIHKPLAGLGASAMFVVSPLIAPFFGSAVLSSLVRVCEDRVLFEQLIHRLSNH